MFWQPMSVASKSFALEHSVVSNAFFHPRFFLMNGKDAGYVWADKSRMCSQVSG